MDNRVETAKKVITEELERAGIKPVRILLFGSRAREDAEEDSDFDFLVVVDREIDREKKWEIILNIKRRLTKLKIPNDLIINSEKQVQETQNNVGYITYYALKEGLQV